MKICRKAKDGGPDSNVTGYWLIEWKTVFSIVLLRFSEGSREAYHTHAFDAVSWIIKGEMHEYSLLPETKTVLKPSILPIFTPKKRLHKVYGVAKNTWALSFRGPWSKYWYEYFDNGKVVTLTHGRKIVE
jgi:hypothetical protein